LKNEACAACNNTRAGAVIMANRLFSGGNIKLGARVGYYTEEILRNARRVNELKARIDETVKFRDKNEHKRKEWQNACYDFHKEYNSLAFPGGYEGALERLLDGDPKTMEAAICFLEARPYFFRSGYMFKDLLRKAKKAPLSEDQRKRFNEVYDAYIKYRESRND
jgi:hypothetical protein